MPTLRISFGDDTPFQIAKRVAVAASPGDYLAVDDYLFQVTRDNGVVRALSIPTIYRVESTEALAVPDAQKSQPEKTPEAAPTSTPTPTPTPAPTDGRRMMEQAPVPEPTITQTPPAPKKSPKIETLGTIRPGAKLVPKDARRKHQVITVRSVLEDIIETETGRVIKKARLGRYQVL